MSVMARNGERERVRDDYIFRVCYASSNTFLEDIKILPRVSLYIDAELGNRSLPTEWAIAE